MDQTTDIINRVLPILFMIGLGNWIRRSAFLAESTFDDLRKIAVNIALPAVLFISFLNIELELSYLVLFIVIFVLSIVMFGLGTKIQQRLAIEREYFPFLMTGFEYGMLGVSLFGSAYGLDQIGYIAVMDLGHEIFIWFVFLALLLMRRDGLGSSRELVGAFFKSPVIIAIIASLFFNIAGARDDLYEQPVTGAFMSTLEFLSNLTIPLVLIIVGHGIRLDLHGMRDAALVIGVRLALLIPLALLLNVVLVDGLLNLEEGFQAALFTLFILPPPFIIPLYMRSGIPDERAYINNVLMLYTMVSVVIFSIYLILNPTI